MRVSVLMSIYHRESPLYLAQSLDSLATQTLPPDEIVIVKDGPVSVELDRVISRYSEILPVSLVELPVNRGLGQALRVGVEHCQFEWIARMDSDDICVPHRFETQIGFLDSHPEVDVLGSSISEFDHDHNAGVSWRCLPEHHEAIRSFATHRNPLNHMTVIFRKKAVLAAGNYRDVPGFEDYDLWTRMLTCGSHFRNLVEPLVMVRCGNGMQQRRGSVRYARQEIALFWSFRQRGFLTTREFLRNIAVRVPLRILPGGLRSWVYQSFLRHPRPAVALIRGQDARN